MYLNSWSSFISFLKYIQYLLCKYFTVNAFIILSVFHACTFFIIQKNFNLKIENTPFNNIFRSFFLHSVFIPPPPPIENFIYLFLCCSDYYFDISLTLTKRFLFSIYSNDRFSIKFHIKDIMLHKLVFSLSSHYIQNFLP